MNEGNRLTAYLEELAKKLEDAKAERGVLWRELGIDVDPVEVIRSRTPSPARSRPSVSTSFALADRMFDIIDTNQDGVLTRSEFEAAMVGSSPRTNRSLSAGRSRTTPNTPTRSV